jgi:hypothetical protein
VADLSKLSDEELLALSAKYKAKTDLSSMSDEQLLELKGAPQWSDLPGNIIPSAGKAVEDFGQLVAHPWDTAASILEVGAGAISQAFPDFFENSSLQEAEAKAKMVGEAMLKRYGGADEIKNTMITDPVGFAMDVAGIIGGGAALAGKAGMITANTAGKITNAANWADPLMATGKAGAAGAKFLGKLPKAIPGHLSGLGEGAVTELYEAGKKGGTAKETAVGNMRDPDGLNADNILKWAREGVKNLKEKRGNEYRSGLVDIKNDAAVLDFGKIRSAFNKVINENTFNGRPRSKAKGKALEEVGALIDEWEELGPDNWTPEGMDVLKQNIGELTDWTKKDEASNRAYLEMYDVVRGEITNQAPVYGKMMGDYSEASRQIKELERTLSLKDTASADTTFRKLTSALRNNVNTNFGQRAALVGQLEEASGKPLKAAISGQSASSIAPRGVQGLGATGNITAAAVSGLSPWQIPLLAMQSPRVVGEAAVAAGSGVRKLGDMASALTPQPVANMASQYGPTIRNAASMVGALMSDPKARIAALQAGRVPGVTDQENYTRMQSALGVR